MPNVLTAPQAGRIYKTAYPRAGQIAYDSISLHPNTSRVIEQDDFRSYANYAPFTATLPARFADGQSLSNAAFETVGGRQCLTAYEWAQGSGSPFLCTKVLPSSLRRVWWRGQYWIPSSVHANNNYIALDIPVDSTDYNFEADMIYQIGFDPAENWQITVIDTSHVPMSLASLQGRWVDAAWLLDSEEQEFYTWVDGAFIGSQSDPVLDLGVG